MGGWEKRALEERGMAQMGLRVRNLHGLSGKAGADRLIERGGKHEMNMI
jgi:hypothetical protein